MARPLRNLLLTATLIAIPAGGFALATHLLSPDVPTTGSVASASPGLGDLSAYRAIVDDAQRIAGTGDLAAAERRITDLEVLWDSHASELRQRDSRTWNTIDTAADDAFAALRSRTPEPIRVDETLTRLRASLNAPVTSNTASIAGAVQTVDGIAVTDATGRALPCEELVGQLRDALANTTPAADVADLQGKALERCKADDDAHADAFAAQALARIKG